jgi:hypothetical protein
MSFTGYFLADFPRGDDILQSSSTLPAINPASISDHDTNNPHRSDSSRLFGLLGAFRIIPFQWLPYLFPGTQAVAPEGAARSSFQVIMSTFYHQRPHPPTPKLKL